MVYNTTYPYQDFSAGQDDLHHTPLGGKNGSPEEFLLNVVDALLDYLQTFSSYTTTHRDYAILPLDNMHFFDLCESVYWEVIRRGGFTQHHTRLELGIFPMQRLESLQWLHWLPINILNGIVGDVCSEIFRRFPNIPMLRASTNLYQKQATILLSCPTISDSLSSTIADTNATNTPSTTLDLFTALTYLDSIKNRFRHHRTLFRKFLAIVDDFNSQRVDSWSLSQRVNDIFLQYPALVEGFFLPSDICVATLLESWERHSSSKPKIANKQKHAKSRNDNTSETEPFCARSSSCLDGQISGVSKYLVASGGYSDVWTGNLGERKVAIKVTRGFNSLGTRILRSKLLKRIWREYLVWSNLRHENVLECLGFSYDFCAHAEHGLPSLISPWMAHGTVPSYMEANPKADWLELLIGIARGLCYLHSREPAVVHGDVRAGNVLVSDKGIPKLNDFGLSKIISNTAGMSTSAGPAGSLRWMAPELLHNESVSKKSDVWAFGMTILEVATGSTPYQDFSLDPMALREIVEGRIPMRPAEIGIMTDRLWEICLRCWRLNPIERLDMQDILVRLTRLCT